MGRARLGWARSKPHLQAPHNHNHGERALPRYHPLLCGDREVLPRHGSDGDSRTWQRPVQRPVGLPQARGRRHCGTILPCKPQAGPRLASPAGGPPPSSVKRPVLCDRRHHPPPASPTVMSVAAVPTSPHSIYLFLRYSPNFKGRGGLRMTSACVGSESLFYGIWRTTSRCISLCPQSPRNQAIVTGEPPPSCGHRPVCEPASGLNTHGLTDAPVTRTDASRLHRPRSVCSIREAQTRECASAMHNTDARAEHGRTRRTWTHAQNTDMELEAPVHAHQPALGGPPSSIPAGASTRSAPCSFLLLPLLRGPDLGSLLNSCSKHSLWWPDSHVRQPAFADHRRGMGALAAGGRWATRENEDRKQEKALSRPQRSGCTGRIHSERTIQTRPSMAYPGILGEGRRATVHPTGKTGKGKARPAGPPPAGRVGAPLRGLCRR